jgi:hypothetical protein
VIVPDARWVDWIAAGDTRLFLAINVLGARPANTESHVAAVPLTGGDPVALPGTEALGVAITGVAVSGDVVYFSRVGGPSLRDSGVFRYSGGRSVPVVGGPRSTPMSCATGDDVPATTAVLCAPAAIVFNDAGDLFIADTSGGRVRRVSNDTITTYAGRGGCGDVNPPDCGPATSAALCGPELVAWSPAGELYIARKGSPWIAKVDPAGELSVFVKDFAPSSLAVDANGALLAGDGADHRLVRFDAAGTPTVVADDLGFISAISVGDDGSIYVVHSTGAGGMERVTRLRAV